LLAVSCASIEEWLTGNEWRSPRVVKVTGVEELCDVAMSSCSGTRAGRPAAILARDGDIFSSKKGPFIYRENDGESLVIEDGEVVLLNGKTVSVLLEDGGKGWEWLRKASAGDLASLRLLVFGAKRETLDFSVLEKVAQIRPDLGLLWESGPPDETDRVVRLLTVFEPRILQIKLGVLSARFDELEPRLTKLEMLWTVGEGSLDFLPRLPRLRALWLEKWLRAGSAEIPSGVRNLRSVAIRGGVKIEDLSFLRNVRGLQELRLFLDVNGLKDVTALAGFPELRKLEFVSPDSKNVQDISNLGRLPKLAWLKFPYNTSQETFAKVIASHPDLEIVVVRSEHIRDLSPLQSLRHPRAAILSLKGVDLAPLYQLKSLEYLGLHKDYFKGDAAKKTEALEKALPSTFVAQAEPFCLGSGWILLLLPVMFLFRSLWSRGQSLGTEAHA
jgi:hypothetical protein